MLTFWGHFWSKTDFFKKKWKNQFLVKNFPKNILFQKSQYNSLQLFFLNKQNGFDDFFTKLILLLKTNFCDFEKRFILLSVVKKKFTWKSAKLYIIFMLSNKGPSNWNIFCLFRDFVFGLKLSFGPPLLKTTK